MATIISFASQKGGVGKTTSAVHLASALAIGGYRVLLVDLDPQGSVKSLLGVRAKIDRGTLDLYCKADVALKDLLIPSGYENLDLILSNMDHLVYEQEVTKAAGDYHYLNQWLDENARSNYDFIILDAPASTGPISINALVASDLIIVPLQCEALAIKSLKRFLTAFNDLQKNIAPNLRIAGILLTMYDRNIPVHRLVCKQVYTALDDSVFQTIIPKCTHILEASTVGKDVINRTLSSIGATGYIRLAHELLDRFNLR
ncbi:MAG: ParA family protein [SAR324 cluster bacterium]|nr:ParA family protein [SAR324 cluster bacterium]